MCAWGGVNEEMMARHNGIYVASSTLAQTEVVPFNVSSMWKEPLVGNNPLVKNNLYFLIIIK